MAIEREGFVAYSEKDTKTDKWCYMIMSAMYKNTESVNNYKYKSELFFKTEYIYNTEDDANNAIITDGKFEYYQELSTRT